MRRLVLSAPTAAPLSSLLFAAPLHEKGTVTKGTIAFAARFLAGKASGVSAPHKVESGARCLEEHGSQLTANLLPLRVQGKEAEYVTNVREVLDPAQRQNVWVAQHTRVRGVPEGLKVPL